MRDLAKWQEYFIPARHGSYGTNFNGYLTFVADGYNSLKPAGQPNFDKPVYLGLMMSPAQLQVLIDNRQLFDKDFCDALDKLAKNYEEVEFRVG